MIGTLIGLVQMLNNLKDPSGIGKGMAVIQLQNGTPKVIYPTDGAQSKFVYPIP